LSREGDLVAGGLEDYSTLVIAVATVTYVVVTAFLWRETKNSADAAKSAADAARLSAEASKKSADIDAELHRPFLGVSVFRRQNDLNSDTWAIHWAAKNYGTLPALDVKIEVVVDRNEQGEFGREVGCSGWEMLPQADLGGSLGIKLDGATRSALFRGDLPMAGHVNITYRSFSGAPFIHRADFAYDPASQNFKPKSSQSSTLAG
jgi:hypothetical protein